MIWQLSSLAVRATLKREHPTFILPPLITMTMDTAALKTKAGAAIESIKVEIERTNKAIDDRAQRLEELQGVWLDLAAR